MQSECDPGIQESIGKFKEVDELKQVTGIGDKTFERLQDSISVK
ncbi:helix-hairpin-helix domain-containing protein [[Brevibacterium] frigoritolerans]|uniref:Helix-hairpin-helix domain-containing protein n=1 Tax=Peribacillus frigoritolerans TaxID=450367 RepID=A0A941FI94_9BACI|nr:helix-hairpin-helix domain-containing protein [Peribacillus frigoritolerans]